MRRISQYLLLIGIVVSIQGKTLAAGIPTPESIALIPQPQHVIWNKKQFSLHKVITLSGISEEEASLFKSECDSVFQLDVFVDSKASKNGDVSFQYDSSLTHTDEYALSVEKKKITIRYRESGHVFALQTLFQLIQTKGKGHIVPCCEINDWPRFGWRGMHLDVSRHFFTVETVKRYIDFMAMYKFNVFHWHLTDDQGWRIEIKSFPKLTEIGAWRKGSQIGAVTDNTFDTLPYGGFYTQEEVRDIVAYAQTRHIQVVPEIEMPGHSQAAISAYPKLACNDVAIPVMNGWGVSNNVFCTKDESFEFIRQVLTEVAALFPSPIIHIGGDECPKEQWKKCTRCQDRIREEQLKDEFELQSYFIRRVEHIAAELGKTIIGWDEILEGGLAPNARVMSWRGMDGGIAAARQQHEVVMTPGAYCYFDHYQSNPEGEPHAIGGFTTVQKVYGFEPVPSELADSLTKYILGAQANMWTEYVQTPEHLEYMILPRMCALSEVLWTEKEQKNENQFLIRLQNHLPILDALHVHYAHSLFDVSAQTRFNSDKRQHEITLSDILSQRGIAKWPVEIHYTTQGEEPSMQSNRYTEPFNVSSTTTIKAALFYNSKPLSKIYRQTIYVNAGTGKPITLKTPPDPQYNCGGLPGLNDGISVEKVRVNSKWMGWRGNDMDATIDLMNDSIFRKIRIGVLKQEVSWIHAAKTGSISISSDSIHWKTICEFDSTYLQNHPRTLEYTSEQAIQARYVRIYLQNQGKIPAGFPGEHEKAWLFADEIQIEQ